MMRIAVWVAALGLALGAPCAVLASDLFIYPKQGQDKAQQDKDEYECFKWAKAQSGVDPGQAPAAADRSARTRGTLGGAARGAALGAAIGAIAGDAGKGAAIGAATGGVAGRRGGIRRERQAEAQHGNDYDRAFSACLDARGYTVR